MLWHTHRPLPVLWRALTVRLAALGLALLAEVVAVGTEAGGVELSDGRLRPTVHGTLLTARPESEGR